MGIEHRSAVTYGVIHYSDRFPVVRTTCGRTRCPANFDWAFVDCEACLEAGPDDPRIREQLAKVRAERQAREE